MQNQQIYMEKPTQVHVFVLCYFPPLVTWRNVTKVRINENGLSSRRVWHCFQVAEVPTVSFGVVAGHKGFAGLRQPDHPDHLYLILHLHVQMTIHIAETKVEGLKKKKALGYFTWPFILLSGLIFCLGT